MVQYGAWLGKAVQGDLSQSLLSGEKVVDSISRAFPNTLLIVAIALMLAWANDFRAVFAVAIIPALLSVALLFFGVQDPSSPRDGAAKAAMPFAASPCRRKRSSRRKQRAERFQIRPSRTLARSHRC